MLMLDHPRTLQRKAKDFSRYPCSLSWRADMRSHAAGDMNSWPASPALLYGWMTPAGVMTTKLLLVLVCRSTQDEPRILFTCMKQDSEDSIIQVRN